MMLPLQGAVFYCGSYTQGVALGYEILPLRGESLGAPAPLQSPARGLTRGKAALHGAQAPLPAPQGPYTLQSTITRRVSAFTRPARGLTRGKAALHGAQAPLHAPQGAICAPSAI